MTQHTTHIAVIGAGTIGLTSAIRLRQAGHPVTIFTAALTPHTTSDIAAAYWAPNIALYSKRLRTWTETSWQTFVQLAEEPESGVSIVDLYELFDVPHDLAGLEDLTQVDEIPPGQFPAPWVGVKARVAKIDVPVYMPRILAYFRSLGGEVVEKEIVDLAELGADYPLIINCTGLGARKLASDESLYPIRGQVIRVRKPAGIAPHIISASRHDTYTYIIPRSGDCLLGGTFLNHNYSTEPDATTAKGILDRCAQFVPALRDAEILQHRVGLRPGREEVRLEVETLSSGVKVIHNYGHAAYGHTLSWGCAVEVVEKAAEVEEKR